MWSFCILNGQFPPFGYYLLAEISKLFRLASFIPANYSLQLLSPHNVLAPYFETLQNLENAFPQGNTGLDPFSIVSNVDFAEPLLEDSQSIQL